MDRNREVRRSTMAATNGLLKRRHRTTSLRESLEEDVVVELQETGRLRDRGTGKKDRERERLSRSKRRRADRLMHGSNREDAGEESSEDSVNDEEDEDDEDCGGSVGMLPPNPSSMTLISNHRKSFPPAKTFRTAASWKAADEMIGVSVPRKARSVSTKRSHDSWTPTAGVGAAELIHRQASTSPVRPSVGSATASVAPASPSSSNASARKKPKSNGPKLRPPKSSSKSSSAQDEIEIEIAEVLYGMMRQPQWPSKQEITASDSLKFDSREVNKTTSDSKSRVSSPISNSSSALPLPSSILTQNSVSTITSISAMGPKRKRPRPNKYDDENPSIFSGRNGPIFSTTKPEADHAAKTEMSPHNFKKSSGFLAENGRVAVNTGSSQVTQSSSEVQIEHIKPESYVLSDSSLLVAESNGKDLGMTKEEPQSPKNETLIPILNQNNPDEKIPTKPHSSMVECENQREEKFQIDLMAPPPFRSSPERNVETDFVAVDPKYLVTEAEMETAMAEIKEDEKAAKIGRGEEGKAESKAKSDDVDSRNHPVIISKEKNIDLPVDLEKTERDAGYGSLSNNKLRSSLAQKQQQQQPSISDKAGQAISLPFPVSVAGWPTGLSPMGYVTPLPGVVSIDGSSVSSTAMQPPNLLFPQPPPKRCATHCYIARNICYHQQIARMNRFWPSAPGPGSMFGAKHCNPNGLPPSSDFHGNLSGKNVNSLPEKAQSLPIFSAKDNKPPQSSTIVDVSQRKQILVQQSLPPGAPNNILGPAFIFPLSQQQAAAAASVRPAGSVKSPTSGTISSAASVSSSVSGPPTAAIAGPTMSFNYPNMPSNETQYLAILQNNGYSFPIPAHVGALPGYRGAHPPAMPFFNGSFYSSQMIHPPPSGQPQLSQQGPPSSIIAAGSSSNQKHLQSQQSRSHASGSYGGVSGNLQGFPSKNHSSQTLQLQQARPNQLETDIGGEESPSTADSRVSRSNINVYGQNFAMPIYSPTNFSSINPPVPIASGGEKHSQLQGGSKTGVEPSQAFALSFASINGSSTTPGIDLSTIATNHPMFQNLPEVTRHGYQIMAAAQVAAQQKKIYQDGNTKGGDNSSNVEEERKTSTSAGKTPAPTIGQSIAFSRTELSDTSASTIPGGTAMVDSSARRPSGSVMPQVPSVISSPYASNSQQQMQRNQQHLMFQKQQQFTAARNKTPPTSNGGGVYSDHLPSPSSMAAKFPNALSSFSQNLVQSNSATSPAHSPQWKNSARATTTSQVPTQSVSSTASSTKTLLQQSNRPQQSHTQISFAANPKSSVQNQVQQSVSGQTPSPPLMAGSPTSSISKSAGGSPRLASSTPTGNKTGQAAVASQQQIKNSQPLPNQKSILRNPHITSSSSPGNKTQLSPQQHLSKQSLQQAQVFFSHPYMQAQASHSTSPSTPSAGSGYYLQRRRGEPQPAAHGQPPATSGMLSLSPITLDPAKAVAVASLGSNVKSGSGLPSSAILHAAQYSASHPHPHPHPHPPGMPAGFPYIHTVSTAALQVKPGEQKQPAGE